MGCKGLTTIDGLRVAVSGWVHVDGTHVARRELAALVKTRGAIFQGEFNFETDLVVRGEYRPHQLQDDRIGGADAIDQLALPADSPPVTSIWSTKTTSPHYCPASVSRAA